MKLGEFHECDSTPMGRPSSPSCRRVYYRGTSNFEQSLDVYTPPSNLPSPAHPLPLVVLVVGSAWLGHRSIIYRGTSWWNSSGPRTVANLGAVCVCVRHRGAFPRPPPLHFSLALVPLIALAVGLALSQVVAASTLATLIIGVWHLAARGAATHEQMLDDVCSALHWVRANRDDLVPTPGAPRPRSLVFGGYSSGAHVAVSLLQQPARLVASGLPRPCEGLCDGILLLSGVLGSRLGGSTVTDAILAVCFGLQGARALPSPVDRAADSPSLPHLLIGCEREVFGLPVLDASLSGVFFRSRELYERLRARGVPATLREIRSDHWSVLNSRALAEALRSEMVDKAWPLKPR